MQNSHYFRHNENMDCFTLNIQSMYTNLYLGVQCQNTRRCFYCVYFKIRALCCLYFSAYDIKKRIVQALDKVFFMVHRTCTMHTVLCQSYNIHIHYTYLVYYFLFPLGVNSYYFMMSSFFISIFSIFSFIQGCSFPFMNQHTFWLLSLFLSLSFSFYALIIKSKFTIQLYDLYNLF